MKYFFIFILLFFPCFSYAKDKKPDKRELYENAKRVASQAYVKAKADDEIWFNFSQQPQAKHDEFIYLLAKAIQSYVNAYRTLNSLKDHEVYFKYKEDQNYYGQLIEQAQTRANELVLLLFEKCKIIIDSFQHNFPFLSDEKKIEEHKILSSIPDSVLLFFTKEQFPLSINPITFATSIHQIAQYKPTLLSYSAEIKISQAKSCILDPLRLKQVPESIKTYGQAAKLYREASNDYQEAINHLHSSKGDDRIRYENRKEYCRQVAEQLENDASGGLSEKAIKQKDFLNNQLIALKNELSLTESHQNVDDNLDIYKRMIPILEELVEVGEATKEELTEIYLRRFIYEQLSRSESLSKPVIEFSQEEFNQREQIRRENFFKAIVTAHKDPFFLFHTTIDPFKNCRNPSDICVISLDAQQQESTFFIPLNIQINTYQLFANQYYRFLIKGSDLENDLYINVYKDHQLIHTEKIATSSFAEYGMISIPKSSLQSQYGLDLRLSWIDNFHGERSLMISHKANTTSYEFSVCTQSEPLYALKISPSMPWQLDFLRKPVISISNELLSAKLKNISHEYEKQSEFFNFPDYPLLKEFVQQMNGDPLAIVQYVYNEIDFVDFALLKHSDDAFHPPVMYRSPIGTWIDGVGSAWEQCVLLVHLLRQAGHQAQYAIPTTPYSLQKKYAERLYMTEIPDNSDQVLVNYPWVLLLHGDRWIHLFPWMKDVQIQSGHDLYAFMPDEFSNAEQWIKHYLLNDQRIMQHVGSSGNDTVGELFPKFVTHELQKQGLSLEDVGLKRTIRKRQFNSWEDCPCPEVKDFTSTYGLKVYFAKIEIDITSSQNPNMSIIKYDNFVWDLNLNPLILEFVGDKYLVIKRWDNDKQLTIAELPANDPLINLKVTQKDPNSGDITQNFTLWKGTAAVFSLSHGLSSPKATSFFAEKLKETHFPERKLYNLLAFMAASYFEKCSRTDKLLSDLHKINPCTRICFGLTKLSPEISSNPIHSHILVFPQIDMIHNLHYRNLNSLSWNQEKHFALSQFASLSIADTSSNEHQVIREIFQDPYAISTVKLLQIAHAKHQKKNLPGSGFLVFTPKIFAEADFNPQLAQSTHFAQLPELNLAKIKQENASMWKAIANMSGSENSAHGYAYMTPMPISSLDGSILRRASYTGMGTLIISPTIGKALISDGSSFMNGGYGSRLPGNWLKDLQNNQFDLVFRDGAYFLQNLSSINNPLSYEFELDRYLENTSLALYDHNLDFYKFFPYIKEIFSDIQYKDWLPEEIWTTVTSTFKPFKEFFSGDVRNACKSAYDLAADPVDIVLGTFYIDEIDLVLPGAFPLEIRRNYNSQNPTHSFLGYGWKWSLNPQLVEKEDKLLASEADGTVILYRFNPEKNRWIVHPEDNPDLRNFNIKGIGGTANPFHGYIEKHDDYIFYGTDGSKRIFHDFYLSSWTDHLGNTLSFSYKENKLVKIESTNGSYIGFIYNHNDMVSEVYTKDGRRIQYNYDHGDLTEVTLPNGAVTKYEYDLRHQIIRETKPHGRILENIYKEDKVVKQLSPWGPQQTMVVSATFQYEEEKTIVTDAEGFSSIYCIHDKQIYKIIDPLGYQTLHSWFIDTNSWFDAETEQILPWDQSGAWPRSLKSTKDKRGLLTEYLYDDRGNPIEINLIGEDLTGNGTTKLSKKFTYNERNLCYQDQSCDHQMITFYDDAFPYLTKRIENWFYDKLLSYVDYEYTSKGQIKKEDRSGSITEWEYDDRGFPKKQTLKTGTNDDDVVIEYKFNHQGQCREKISSDGIVKNEYDIVGNNFRTTTYNLSGKILSSSYAEHNLNNAPKWQEGSDPNHLIFFDYHPGGKVKVIRQQLTRLIDGVVHNDQAAYQLFDYDTRGNCILEVDPLGNCTHLTYNPLGWISSITKENLTTTTTYEAGGLIESITSPRGSVNTRNYTTNGLLKEIIYPDGTNDSYIYDAFGRVIQETLKGITWEIIHDEAAQKVICTHPKTGIQEIKEFDSRGNLIRLTDPEGYIREKVYDGLNRLINETSPNGEQTTWSYQGDTVICTLPSFEIILKRYEAGTLVETKTLDPQGNILSHSTLKRNRTQSFFEETNGITTASTLTNTRGQPLLVTQGDLTTAYSYDLCGNCITVIDGCGRTTGYEYDEFNRVKKKTLPDGAEIKYQYDPDSNLSACHLPEGVAWTAEYDLMGRKQWEKLQAGGQTSQHWTFSFVNGLLAEKQDPIGRTHTYTYDTLSRLETDTVDRYKRRFKYDNRGLITLLEQSGRDFPTKVERKYNEVGILESESFYLDGKLLQQTQQTWKPNHRTLQIGNHQRDFFYENGRLKSLIADGIALAYEYENGILSKTITPHHAINYRYYPSGLPETILTNASGNSYLETMQWDLSGKLSTHASPWNAQTNIYTYSSRGQLKHQNDDTYIFDNNKPGLGIRTAAPEWTVPANGLDPFGKIMSEISQGKSIQTSYNPIGQVINRTCDKIEQTYKWDPWGNLVEITTPTHRWKAFYDALGRRLQTIDETIISGLFGKIYNDPKVMTSLYDPEKEFDEIGVNIDGKTFWKLGQGQCEAIIDDEGNGISLIHDAQGNLTGIISGDQILWTQELPTPYGALFGPVIMPKELLSFAQAHAWQSQRQDSTGLIWMGARYYDPIGGRFLSPDPIGYPLCLDLYNYANGDPINFSDPDGRLALPIFNPVLPVCLKNLHIAGGVHGALDFAISNAHVLEQGAMYFGSDDLGFSLENRGSMFYELSQRQAYRVNALGSILMDAQGIDHNDSRYNYTRYGTTLSLEIASLAAGAYSLGKGAYYLARGINLSRSLLKNVPKLAEFQSLRAFESNKIFVRNYNTKIHIMQPKHAWDKLIKTTGNIETDCEAVIKLLKDNKIYLEKYRQDVSYDFDFPRYEHQMNINGLDVKAFFNHNPETGKIFLNNAWIITK
jgi:RHS repeat-associated protein